MTTVTRIAHDDDAGVERTRLEGVAETAGAGRIAVSILSVAPMAPRASKRAAEMPSRPRSRVERTPTAIAERRTNVRLASHDDASTPVGQFGRACASRCCTSIMSGSRNPTYMLVSV
jgi:hypothetical protein